MEALHAALAVGRQARCPQGFVRGTCHRKTPPPCCSANPLGPSVVVPSSGQARRPVPTVNNTMIGIPSLLGETFSTTPQSRVLTVIPAFAGMTSKGEEAKQILLVGSSAADCVLRDAARCASRLSVPCVSRWPPSPAHYLQGLPRGARCPRAASICPSSACATAISR